MMIPFFILLFLNMIGISKSLSDKKVKFYMYQLPDNIVDTWPISDKNLTKWTIYDSIFRENNGAGPILDKDRGIYGTWQFSVFKLIYNRLLRSPQRVYNPELADIFFIPYDGGIDATVSAWNGRLLKSRCPRSGVVKSFLSKNANATIYMKRHGGADHFLVFSVIQGVSSLASPGCKVLYRQVCKKCTKLTIEVSYHKKKGDELVERDVNSKDRNAAIFSHDPTWYSIPYPASYHYHDDLKIRSWEAGSNTTTTTSNSNSNSSNSPKSTVVKKTDLTWTAVYIGGRHTTNARSNKLRDRLHKECLLDIGCKWVSTTDTHLNTKTKGAGTSITISKDTAKKRTGKVGASIAQMLSFYRNSIFCLSPPGDSPTRKGLFDSLLSGCIPVVFDDYSLNDQYHLHITREDIPHIAVKLSYEYGNDSFMKLLRDISADKIAIMKNKIAQLAMSLQYSLPPLSLSPSSSSLSSSSSGEWDPPEMDAVNVLLDGVYKIFLSSSSNTDVVKRIKK